jgi:hypothetical protein
MFFIGNVVWAYLEVVLGVEPFPSIADVFYLAYYPLALWGLLRMPSLRQNRRERLTLWLDLLCVFTAAAMFVGYFIIVPTAAVSSPDFLTQMIAPAYPWAACLYLVAYWSSCTVLPLPIRSLRSACFDRHALFLGGDFAFGYTSLTGTYAVGGWTDASWNVAQLFLCLAALRKLYHAPGSPVASRTWVAGINRFARWLPPIAVGLGYGLVFQALITQYSQSAEWLVAGAADTHPPGDRPADRLACICRPACAGQNDSYLYHGECALVEFALCDDVSNGSL